MGKARKIYSENIIKVPKFCEENGFYTSPDRSRIMSRIRATNTKPEIIFKKTIWHSGLRYRRCSRKFLGKPDIVFIKYKLVVFIDGAFWHGYNWKEKQHSIKTNRDFWLPKIQRNIQRDKEVNRFYRERGWTVLRFWDHEIKKNLGTCVKQVLDHARHTPLKNL